jgi:signal transduction histidine kinase
LTIATERLRLLSIEDDGPGMDARTRAQAFDDFFTTKATGSGLGLSSVRRHHRPRAPCPSPSRR